MDLALITYNVVSKIQRRMKYDTERATHKAADLEGKLYVERQFSTFFVYFKVPFDAASLLLGRIILKCVFFFVLTTCSDVTCFI